MSDDIHNHPGWGKPSYEVGYGKPPREHQFQRGQSGNPKGRKPKTKNVSTLLSNELDKLITIRDGAAEKHISKREALVTSLVNDAIKGNATARQLLLKVLDVSPPPEPLVATPDDDAAIEAFLARVERSRNAGEGERGAPDGTPT